MRAGAALLVALASVGCGAASAADRTEALLDRMETALGGRAAYERLGSVAFRLRLRAGPGERVWVVRHDVRTGETVLEGLDAEGRPVTARLRPPRLAEVVRDTAPLVGDEAAAYAEEARLQADLALWGALGPWRLRDPRLRVAAGGRRTGQVPAWDGRVWETLEVEAPTEAWGDAAGSYLLYLDEAGRPVRWVYRRADGSRGEEAWGVWREAGGLLWPAVRRNEAGGWAYILDEFEAAG